MRVALIFNSFCFVRGSFWASGEALHGAPLAESANPPKSSKPRVFPRFGVKFAQKRVFFHVFGFKIVQNHAFFDVLASNLLKNACFSTFLASKCLKATRFSTFWRQICSKTRVFPRFWLQNASKPRFFLRFGFRIAQKHAFFHVLASEFLKNTRVSTYLASKRCVFPRFGFRIAQKRVFFNVFAFKVAQSLVFSQVLASTLFKNVHLLNFLFTNCYSGGSTQVNATEALLLPGLGLKIEGDHAPTWRQDGPRRGGQPRSMQLRLCCSRGLG